MKSSSFPVILNSDSVVFVMDNLGINQGYPIFGNEIYVLSEDATNVTFNSATLNGLYSGTADIKGFRYKAVTDSVYNTVYCSLSEPYSYSLSGLSEGTDYQYYYFVQRGGSTYYGNVKTFSTISCDVSLDIVMPTAAICSGDSVILIATAHSDYTNQFSYLWSTGEDGGSILPNTNGTYTVTATADNACSQTASYVLSLYPSPNGIITGDTVLCNGNSVTLSASGAWSYRWNTGSTGTSINVTTPGTYSCTFTNEYGCTSSENVVVRNLSDYTISGNPNLCIGGCTTLSIPPVESCVWSNGSHGFSITVTEAGTYSVNIYHGECSATANVTVTVNPLPNVSISGTNSFCQGDNTILTASGASTYLWNNASTTANLTITAAGTYSVTGTDANGCSNSATTTVSVNPTYTVPLTHSICQGETYHFYGQNLTLPGVYTHSLQTANGCDSILSLTLTVRPLPMPTISGNTSVCEGESTTLTVNGGISYLWSNANTQSSITVSQSGIYTVTATNAENCSATANVTVTVNPLPTVSISGDNTICQGSSTTLTANGADSYLWSTGDQTASVTLNAFGVYTVTGTNTAGCSSTANVTVLVSQLPVITITGATNFCEGESTTLTANGADTYLWSNGTTDASLMVNAAGIYQVIGYNAAGCNSMADVTVTVNYPVTSEFSDEAEGSYTWHDSTYTESGDYTWTGQTIHGCDSVVTLHLTITPTDTTGIATYDGRDLTLYPNPTTGMVTVKLSPETCNLTPEIHLFDIYGRRLQMISVAGETTQIDLSQYATGIYLVKLVNGGKVVATGKVVKQ